MSEQNGKEKCGDPELQKMILEDEEENYDHLFKETPLNDETTCGFWIFKGSFLQMFANKKAYVFLYGGKFFFKLKSECFTLFKLTKISVLETPVVRT